MTRKNKIILGIDGIEGERTYGTEKIQFHSIETARKKEPGGRFSDFVFKGGSHDFQESFWTSWGISNIMSSLGPFIPCASAKRTVSLKTQKCYNFQIIVEVILGTIFSSIFIIL